MGREHYQIVQQSLRAIAVENNLRQTGSWGIPRLLIIPEAAGYPYGIPVAMPPRLNLGSLKFRYRKWYFNLLPQHLLCMILDCLERDVAMNVAEWQKVLRVSTETLYKLALPRLYRHVPSSWQVYPARKVYLAGLMRDATFARNIKSAEWTIFHVCTPDEGTIIPRAAFRNRFDDALLVLRHMPCVQMLRIRVVQASLGTTRLLGRKEASPPLLPEDCIPTPREMSSLPMLNSLKSLHFRFGTDAPMSYQLSLNAFRYCPNLKSITFQNKADGPLPELFPSLRGNLANLDLHVPAGLTTKSLDLSTLLHSLGGLKKLTFACSGVIALDRFSNGQQLHNQITDVTLSDLAYNSSTKFGFSSIFPLCERVALTFVPIKKRAEPLPAVLAAIFQDNSKPSTLQRIDISIKRALPKVLDAQQFYAYFGLSKFVDDFPHLTHFTFRYHSEQLRRYKGLFNYAATGRQAQDRNDTLRISKWVDEKLIANAQSFVLNLKPGLIVQFAQENNSDYQSSFTKLAGIGGSSQIIAS